jgi:hypothetical protein
VGSTDGYIDLPEGWERVSSEGPGPFVTAELLRRPDGRLVRWQSRSHRKGSVALRGAPPPASDGKGEVWWRPRRRSWWMAVLFMTGSTCFMFGGVASQWTSFSREAIGIVFFGGSIFFTSAAYLQYSEAVNVEHGLLHRRARHRWVPASWEPRRIDWLAALVQLVGTILFNMSTFAALHNPGTSARVWAPDVFGSAAFLISSELAFAEVCHRWVAFSDRTLPWWIVALNLLGSIAFGVSAIASLAEPSSVVTLSTRLANGGTSVGALGFLLASVLLIPEAANEERVSAQRLPGPAAAPTH